MSGHNVVLVEDLRAGGFTFAMYVQRTGKLNGLDATTFSHLHHDHLGSVAAVSNAAGAVVERMAYDAWGKRRYINQTPGKADTLDTLKGLNTHRGYTLHEHLDELGVIHMNGRIYDPLVGRFMSADPYIQAPQNLQSHNRYAYVMNNPLALTDPSGYFSWGKLFGAMLCPICVKEWQRPILIIGLSVASGQWFISLGWAPVAAGAASGFITGFASTGNLNGAIQGGLTGGLFGAAGMVGEGPKSFARYAAHAAAGCISAVASSGSCGHGAVAAVFGKYTTNAIGDSSILSDSVSKGVASAVAGGVGSMIAGGKFENGAVTAAYGYLFNYCVTHGCTPTALGNVRGRDVQYGSGWAGSSRDGGARSHEGTDYTTTPGQDIEAPIGGVVTGVNPYRGDPRLMGVQITNEAGQVARVFYVKPFDVVVGMRVEAGDVIGTAQDLHVKYNSNMTNHVHVEIRVNGKLTTLSNFIYDGK